MSSFFVSMRKFSCFERFGAFAKMNIKNFHQFWTFHIFDVHYFQSRSFNFVRKFRERRRSNANSDSGLVTKNKRSVSPIETGIEVVDDRSIMDLHVTPEEAVVHETAGRFTVTSNGVVTNATQNLDLDNKFLVTSKFNSLLS
jgi:hypothetical protein